jgi:hypothetical protein
MDSLTDYMHRMMSGPGSFRFFIQPLIAIALGIRDGRLDSHAGAPPIFRAGKAQLAAALKRIVVPLLMATGLSLVFQWVILQHLRLGPALVFAAVMVALPYLLARALAERADARWHKTHPRRG